MQAVAQETSLIEESPKPAMRLTIRYEWLAIAVLVVFSTIFHLAGLDEIPLTDNEAHQALSAWRSTMPHTSGDPILSDTPLVWWSQKIAFSLIGGSEFSSRVFTALAGVLVSLSPLMFMPILGRSRAYVMTILLGVSPILLTTARMSGSTTWALLMVVMMLWFAWRFYETSHKKYALSLIITGGFLALMTESQSILL
ncbi:MAG TPA: glycosyltransferase family 39 protein, partial [Aggregatilineales bacterium]|nr:glycosyltransferase family 39 protein [Aggregatilineales bacterium]